MRSESVVESVKDLASEFDHTIKSEATLVALVSRMALAMNLPAGKLPSNRIVVFLPSGQVVYRYHDSYNDLFKDLPDYKGHLEPFTPSFDKFIETCNNALR